MKKIILLLITAVVIMTSCTSDTTVSHEFFAMDTFIGVDAQNTDEKVLKELEKLVGEDEKKYSRTFSGCELYEFNKTGNGDALSSDTFALLKRAFEIHERTDGAFSPYLGTLTDLWDIKSEKPKVPDEADIKAVLKNCSPDGITFDGNTIVKTNKQLQLDLGGIAKGRSAGNCIEFLRSKGVKNAIISFGGSIACIGESKKGSEGWKIGIKNPFATNEIVGSINVSDIYVSVSGAYERFFEKDGKRYHHILDPKTGYPAQTDIESVAVISEDAVISDALSTALFVMGKEKALEFYKSNVYSFEAILMLKDGRVIVTDGIKDVFTFNGDASYKDGKKLIYDK